jgi:hypothetical protein
MLAENCGDRPPRRLSVAIVLRICSQLASFGVYDVASDSPPRRGRADDLGLHELAEQEPPVPVIVRDASSIAV